MTRFHDLPIQRKLVLVTLAPTAAALLLASVGFVAWDITQQRNDIAQDVLAQSRIVSETAATAVQFTDPQAAGQTLGILTIRPHVRFACLYDETGVLFSEFQRDAGAGCPAQPPVESLLGWDAFDIVYPVQTQDNERVGTLYIQRDLTDLRERLRIAATTAVGLLLLAIGIAVLVARGMQRAIATPLLELARTARAVSTTRDYSLRAVPSSKDETGVVVQAFNDMLDRLGERDAELSKANADLEREVEERRQAERERTEALERERDANRLKDEFLATLSHELRTPLNAVLGWTRVLRSARIEPGTEQRALESIERNARAQARLIEDLLEISRIVTGKLRLQVRDADLAAIVDAAVEIVQPAAAAKRLRLTVDIGVRPAPTAGDPDRLQQVIWNLLSNAVKFTPPDGAVTVRLVRENGYRITVQDTGAGIEPRFLPFVFEPFRQADGTASREHGGLGLGLAIAKQLVELHGGTIRVHSEGKERGAIFEVLLPSYLPPTIAPASRDRDGTAVSVTAFDPALLHNVRVLVVDDEEDARVLLETALRQYGADVATAATAADALAELDRRPPDVILSDIGMPHEDGYSLMRRLRARPAAQGGAIPAIAVTAYASDGDRSAAEAAGYQAHVAKPFDLADIARLVARLAGATTRPS